MYHCVGYWKGEMPKTNVLPAELEKEFDEYYPELLTEAGEVSQNVKQFLSHVYAEGVKQGREKSEKFNIDDFIYYLKKYVDSDTTFTASEIANIIGKAMINFFEDSETAY